VPENLLQLLKLCFLALLYLFFLRVVWSVWQQVRTPPAPHAARAAAASPPPPAPAPPPKRKHGKHSSGPPSVLDVVQPSTRAGASFPVGEELTIGRASGCAVSFADDTYVSQLHARVYQRDGIVFLEDLGSTNGTFLNGQRLQAPTAIHGGDRVQIGSTILEAR
jgi:FHA domain